MKFDSMKGFVCFILIRNLAGVNKSEFRFQITRFSIMYNRYKYFPTCTNANSMFGYKSLQSLILSILMDLLPVFNTYVFIIQSSSKVLDRVGVEIGPLRIYKGCKGVKHGPYSRTSCNLRTSF